MADKGPTTEEYLRLWYEGYSGKSLNDCSPEEKEQALKELKEQARIVDLMDKEDELKAKSEWRTTKEPTDEELQELMYGYSASKSSEEKSRFR